MLSYGHGHIVEKACGVGGDNVAGGIPLVVQRVGVWCIPVDGLRGHDASWGRLVAQQGGGHLEIEIGEGNGDGVVMVVILATPICAIGIRPVVGIVGDDVSSWYRKD